MSAIQDGFKQQRLLNVKENNEGTDWVKEQHILNLPNSYAKSGKDALPNVVGTKQRFCIRDARLSTTIYEPFSFSSFASILMLMLALGAMQVAGTVDNNSTLAEQSVVYVHGDQVKDMCDAQCAAMCITLGDEMCESICGKSGQRRTSPIQCSWLLSCYPSGCIGSCSTMPQTDVKGPVPDTPKVSVSRDHMTGQITLSWQLYNLDENEKTVYLVSQKTSDYCSWAQLGWVMGNRYIVTNIPDLCTLPTYRVAAVSRFGSKWFSGAVETPELVPGPPIDLSHRLNDTHASQHGAVIFTLEWKPPTDWPLHSLQFDVLSTVECPNLKDVVYIYRDNLTQITLREEILSAVTGRIPIHAIGCKITFLVGSKPKCAHEVRAKSSSVATTSFIFGCDAMPNNDGPICRTPPIKYQGSTSVYPGPVKNVTLQVMPVEGQKLLARAFWYPPDDLGVADYIESYYLYWGVVEIDQTDLIATFKTILRSYTVPGDQLSEEYSVNIASFQPYETLGLTIQAVGPNQSYAFPISDIHTSVNHPSYDLAPENVIADDATVYVIQSSHKLYDNLQESKDGGWFKAKVDVFWRRPQLSLGMHVTNYHVTLQPKHIPKELLGLNLNESMTSTRHINTTEN